MSGSGWNRIRRWLAHLAIPNLTLLLVTGQVLTFALALGQPDLRQRLSLVPQLVTGEPWRLVTMLFVPPEMHPIFVIFFWYLFYLMGVSLENYWGIARYNLYLLIGYLATVAVSFVTPLAPAGNAFLYGSVFLAFAHLNPDFELALFFILPVKIKWLALLMWLWYAWTVAWGTWNERLAVLASVCNFLLFFARDITARMRQTRRQMARQATSLSRPSAPIHQCRVCGITERSHPQAEFRYCSACAGTCCYCLEHLKNHVHVVKNSLPP